MTTLHTVNKSPFEKSSLDSCLRVMQSESAMLLLEDGVYAAAKGTVFESKFREASTHCPIYVLAPDLEARGLDREACIEVVQLVDYGGFVDLATEHDNVQAWL